VQAGDDEASLARACWPRNTRFIRASRAGSSKAACSVRRPRPPHRRDGGDRCPACAANRLSVPPRHGPEMPLLSCLGSFGPAARRRSARPRAGPAGALEPDPPPPSRPCWPRPGARRKPRRWPSRCRNLRPGSRVLPQWRKPAVVAETPPAPSVPSPLRRKRPRPPALANAARNAMYPRRRVSRLRLEPPALPANRRCRARGVCATSLPAARAVSSSARPSTPGNTTASTYRLEPDRDHRGGGGVQAGPDGPEQRGRNRPRTACVRANSATSASAASTRRASTGSGRVVAYAGREAIVEGTQDMLSMYYQLVLLAPRGGAVEMPIATGRKLAKLPLRGARRGNPGASLRASGARCASGRAAAATPSKSGCRSARARSGARHAAEDSHHRSQGRIFDQIADDTATGDKMSLSHLPLVTPTMNQDRKQDRRGGRREARGLRRGAPAAPESQAPRAVEAGSGGARGFADLLNARWPPRRTC
jgi:hypothetical protein